MQVQILSPHMVKRIWLGGPRDGEEIDVPEGSKTIRVPAQSITSFNRMPEPGDMIDVLECKVTPKYVIWPYPGKEKSSG